jgi:hypothetical protein
LLEIYTTSGVGTEIVRDDARTATAATTAAAAVG